MWKGAPVVAKAAAVIAVGFLLLVGGSAALFWWMVRPRELPPGAASQFIRLQPGDRVLHAYAGARWLDSNRYFLIQADPAGFDARIARLQAVAVKRPHWKVVVSRGPGQELWFPGKEAPSWWNVDSLLSAVAVDSSDERRPHSGDRRIFAKDRGLIYILDR